MLFTLAMLPVQPRCVFCSCSTFSLEMRVCVRCTVYTHGMCWFVCLFECEAWMKAVYVRVSWLLLSSCASYLTRRACIRLHRGLMFCDGVDIENTMNTFIEIFAQYICVCLCVWETATPNECRVYELQRGKNNMGLCFVCVFVACYTNVDNTTFVCLLSCVICLNCVSASRRHRHCRLRLLCITWDTEWKKKVANGDSFWKICRDIERERSVYALRTLCG